MRLPGNIDLAMALTVWRRNVMVYRHTWKANILPNFFEPLLYLVGMGVGLGAYVGESVGGTNYLTFIAPGLVAASAMNGAVFETTYNMFVKMRFGRIYDAYLGTPASIEDVAFGELMWAVTRAMIYGVAFLSIVAAMSLFGVPLLTSPWALLLPFELILIGAVFSLIGQVFTAMIKSIDLYSYFYTLGITPLFLFSGIFFPTERFPYGDTIAWFTPLYHGVHLARGLATGVLDLSHAVDAVWMLTICVILVAITPRLMRRAMVK